MMTEQRHAKPELPENGLEISRLRTENSLLREQLKAAQGVLENIRINLEGDLDRLPAHILLYKLQMIKLRVRIGAEKKGGEVDDKRRIQP
jgi:hypothetical protein